ncbi:sugar kinase [Streptomyces sp. VRA16 Mangrove soil]|uniref:sugar kinase n=1 Tax=Streptomyces sp. VRA16 Mangrove soil TaxID=2817434 RepID=UPI001A9D6BC0|nr:sugar kinase [Streptomyces sp. VRA16 Mangrove soil]MBO1337150.1 sugar kinase [Streptomyces sp. VRA16 Mangrove soil]
MPSPHRPEAICLGETMAQLTPADGVGLEHSGEVRLAVAGAESTVAQYLADLGHRTAWVSRVGDDPFGRRIVASVAGRGVDVEGVAVDRHAPTGVYFKDPGPDGTTRVHYYRRGSAASRMTAADARRVDLDGVRLLHLTGITPALSEGCAELVDTLAERAAAASTLFSFDVNYRPALWSSREQAAEVLLALARRAGLVLVGRDEGEALWGAGTADALHAHLAPRGVLVVKDGAVGATRFSGGASEFVAAPAVDVVEAVGAGDAFAAGYLSGLLTGVPVRERLALGHRLAARTLRSIEDYVPAEGR